jgi:hypothetical protein
VLNRIEIAGFLCILTMASPSWCGESGVVPPIVADASISEMQEGVRAAFRRFVSSQNDHDPSMLSSVLVKSRDFVWAQGGGQSTKGDAGEQPSTQPIRWAGVFVKTAAGWRMSSLIITPYPDSDKP